FNLCSKPWRWLSIPLSSSRQFQPVRWQKFKVELSAEVVSQAKRLRWKEKETHIFAVPLVRVRQWFIQRYVSVVW
ncbi:MAG: hypothetical protein ACRETA_14040, partial [Gammaproteobacteria bacterium]